MIKRSLLVENKTVITTKNLQLVLKSEIRETVKTTLGKYFFHQRNAKCHQGNGKSNSGNAKCQQGNGKSNSGNAKCQQRNEKSNSGNAKCHLWKWKNNSGNAKCQQGNGKSNSGYDFFH